MIFRTGIRDDQAELTWVDGYIQRWMSCTKKLNPTLSPILVLKNL